MTLFVVLDDTQGGVVNYYTDNKGNSPLFIHKSATGWDYAVSSGNQLVWQADPSQAKFFTSQLSTLTAVPNGSTQFKFDDWIKSIPKKGSSTPAPQPPQQQPVPQQPQQPQQGGKTRPNAGKLGERDYTAAEFVAAIGQLQDVGQKGFVDDHLNFLKAKNSQYWIDVLNLLMAANNANQNAKAIASYLLSLCDTNSLQGILKTLPSNQWGSIFTADVVAKMVPTTDALSTVLSGLPSSSWTDFLKLPGALTGVTDINALMGVLNKLQASNSANFSMTDLSSAWSDIFKLPDVIKMIPDLDALMKAIAGSPQGGWKSLLDQPEVSKLITAATEAGKVMTSVVDGDWTSYLSHPAVAPKLNAPNAAQDLVNGFKISDKLGKLSSLITSPAVVKLIADIDSLMAMIPMLASGDWAALLNVQSILDLIPDLSSVGKLLGAVVPGDMGKLLTHPKIAAKLSGMNEDGVNAFVSGYASNKTANTTDLIAIPEFTNSINDISTLDALLAKLAPGSWKRLLDVPHLSQLLSDVTKIGQEMRAIEPKSWADFLGNKEVLPKINALDYKGVTTLVSQQPQEQRSGILSLQPIKDLLALLNTKPTSLPLVGALLNVLPTPSDVEKSWENVVNSLGLKNDIAKIGQFLNGLPLPHWRQSYIAQLLNLPDIQSAIESKTLCALLTVLQPEMRTAFVANSFAARKVYTDLVASNQHADLFKLLDMSKATDADKQTLFVAALDGYKQLNQRTQRHRVSFFNKLGIAKTTLASTAVAQAANQTATFEATFNAVDSEHKALASKANRPWIISNRWQSRLGNKFGANKKAAWDENVDSNLGKIITKFRKP